MIVAGDWTGVGFSNLENSRMRIQIPIQKFWNRSGVGVSKIEKLWNHSCMEAINSPKRLNYRISLKAGDRGLFHNGTKHGRLTMGLMMGTTCLFSNFVFIWVVKVKGVDTWSSSLQGRVASSVATASRYFFSLDLEFFCFIWGCEIFRWKSELFDFGRTFVNVCRITVFSI